MEQHTARKKELCPLILTLSQVSAGVSPSSAALRFRGGGVRPLSATAAPISIVVQVRVQIRYDVRESPSPRRGRGGRGWDIVAQGRDSGGSPQT